MIEKTFTHLEDTFEIVDLNAVTQEDGSRFYETPKGIRYPSVTTVVGHAKREFFKEWREKNAEESKRILAKGTKVHQFVEDYLNNKKVEGTEHYRALEQFDALKPLLHNIDNIYMQEAALWSDALMLAGRVDCIGEYKGIPSVIDFKTSKRLKSKDQIEDYFCQTTAYAIMWQERTGIPINQIVVLITTNNGEIQEYTENPLRFVGLLKEKIDLYFDELITSDR